MNKNNLIIPASILGGALLLSAVILAFTWKSNYNSNQTITVTGSATKDITSDFAILKGNLTTQASTAETAYKELEREKPVLISYLKSKGFSSDKIDFSAITHYPIYEIGKNGYHTKNIKGYTYNQQVQVQSVDVYKIKNLAIDIASLIEKGVNLNVQAPEYHYMELAKLKIDMQAAAAKDAMIRAKKIAEATGRTLGPMRNARMGVIQITPKFSNNVSNYGISDLTSIDKKMTTVVSASFQIE